VVVLLLDAVTGISEQDRLLAERIVEEGRSCVIALNKWDAVPNKDEKTYIKSVENIRSNLPSLKWADVSLCHRDRKCSIELYVRVIEMVCDDLHVDYHFY